MWRGALAPGSNLGDALRMTFAQAALRVMLFSGAATIAGCGLILDVDPPDPKLVDAAITDLGHRDARVPPNDLGAPPVDAGVPELDDGIPAADAGMPELDAGAPDAGGAPTCSLDVQCSDDNPCTDDSCLLPSGTCHHSLSASPCDDGNACTSVDFCEAGVCVGNALIVCPDDDNPCTSQHCDPAVGCVTMPAADGTSCDTDADACTGAVCSGAACFRSVTLCPDLDGNPCTTSVCNPVSGACDTVNLPPGTSCALPYGGGGVCSASGVCVAGSMCTATTLDCDGDGSCECTVTGAGGGCIGPLCIPAATCGVACASGQTCCPCSGLCVARTCIGATCCPMTC